MRRFEVWLDKCVTGSSPSTETVEMPDDATDEECEQACADALDVLIVAAHLSTEGVAYFWGPNCSGYTANLDKAGRYAEAEAKRKDVFSERMEVAVPLSEARAAVFPAVKDDDAHAWHRRRFPKGKPTDPREEPGT